MDVWRSAHLTYRAVEPDDEAFLVSLHSHSKSWVNWNINIADTKGSQSAQRYRQSLENKMLGAVICLSATDTPTSISPKSATADVKAKAIGMISLTNPAPHETRHQRSTLGVCILHEYQGQGYGSEAIQ